jgi:hypothetical protein
MLSSSSISAAFFSTSLLDDWGFCSEENALPIRGCFVLCHRKGENVVMNENMECQEMIC